MIIVNGERVVKHLCSECARIAGLDEQTRLNRKRTRKVVKTPSYRTDIICPGCQLSFSQFVQSGLLGCAHCYSAFDRRLGDILKGIHSATYHRGRGPGEERMLDIAQLKWKLSGAIEAENFELAAQLRDEIKRIEKETN